MCVCVCVFMEVNKEIKSDSRKKVKKNKKKSKFDEYIMKVDVKRFGFNKLLQDFEFVESIV